MNHLIKYKDNDWLSWARSVEAALGHTINGDLSNDGYSVDRAYSFFTLGAHWTEYVYEIKSRPQYQKLCKR